MRCGSGTSMIVNKIVWVKKRRILLVMGEVIPNSRTSLKAVRTLALVIIKGIIVCGASRHRTEKSGY